MSNKKRLKGNSSCHIFTKQGALNYDNVVWDSDRAAEPVVTSDTDATDATSAITEKD